MGGAGGSTYGAALSATQLNATANTPGSFVYSPLVGTVLDAGAHTLSVTFTPTDTANYTSATATTPITVLKATSTITWTAPADLTYGTALNATQLNATANTPGTFVYTPVAGTVLNAGAAQTLSVTFTPTDTANYTGATKTTTITVLKATSTITWHDAGGSDLWHGAERDTAECHGERAGHLRLHPPAGTVLDAGAHTLSVTFTPTDTANYAGATDDLDRYPQGDQHDHLGRRRRI